MGDMLGWQALADSWHCDGEADEHAPMTVGARVWMEEGGVCFCETCGEARQLPDERRRCMAPGCDAFIPTSKPATQATCNRSCGAKLRAANAAAAEASREPPRDGATAL